MSEQDTTGSEKQPTSTTTDDSVSRQLTELAKQNAELKDHVKKLNEENKNRRLTSKELNSVLAETLGLTAGEKPEAEVVKDSLFSLTNQVKELQAQLEKAETEKVKASKESSVKDLATKLNFADPQDALRFIDLDSSDLEAELKKVAEVKPYLLKVKADIKGNNPSEANNVPGNIDEQIAAATKAGDTAKAIALKSIKFKLK